MQRHHLAVEAFGEPHRLRDLVLRLIGQRLVARRADVDRDPGRALPVGHALRRAHKLFRNGRFVQADEQPVLRRPWPGDGVEAHEVDHLRIDTLGRHAHSEFAQRGEIALREEIADGAPRLIRHINLALAQPLHEIVGRQVDQFDLAGEFQHLVGQGLAHLDFRDAGDDVVQAFDVLDVERGVDVDPGFEQFDHVLPAFLVARADDVRMREFVHEGELRAALQNRVEVHFAEQTAAILDLLAGDDVEPREQRFRFGAAMGLDDADDDIHAFLLALVGG